MAFEPTASMKIQYNYHGRRSGTCNYHYNDHNQKLSTLNCQDSGRQQLLHLTIVEVLKLRSKARWSVPCTSSYGKEYRPVLSQSLTCTHLS